MFKSRLGYGGTGFPWTINEAKGIRYDYDPARFPQAQKLCDSYTIVHGVHAPNGSALMEKIVVGFQKVFANLDATVAHADDPIWRRWCTVRCRMTSKGHYGRKPLDVEVCQRELESPGPGQGIMKVRACGVCGTDVRRCWREWWTARFRL